MSVIYDHRVEKLARGIPREDLDRLEERLEQISHDPYGDHQDAKRRKDGAFQVRHGQWRALYRIAPSHDIEVIYVGPRREVNRP